MFDTRALLGPLTVLLTTLFGAIVGGGAYCAAFFIVAIVSGKANDAGQPAVGMFRAVPFVAAAAGFAHGVIGCSATLVAGACAVLAVAHCVHVCVTLVGTNGRQR
jgi:hypothetical protein